MKSERSELVRGSEPPSGQSGHSAAGDAWRAPTGDLIQIHFAADVLKTGDQKSRSDGKKIYVFQVWEKSVGCRGQPRAPYTNGSTCHIGTRHLLSLALPDTTRVDRGLSARLDRKLYRRVT